MCSWLKCWDWSLLSTTATQLVASRPLCLTFYLLRLTYYGSLFPCLRYYCVGNTRNSGITARSRDYRDLRHVTALVIRLSTWSGFVFFLGLRNSSVRRREDCFTPCTRRRCAAHSSAFRNMPEFCLLRVGNVKLSEKKNNRFSYAMLPFNCEKCILAAWHTSAASSILFIEFKLAV